MDMPTKQELRELLILGALAHIIDARVAVSEIQKQGLADKHTEELYQKLADIEKFMTHPK